MFLRCIAIGKELLVEPGAGNRPELLPQLRLDELLSELQGWLQAVLVTGDRMRGLLEAAVAIGSGLDLPLVVSSAPDPVRAFAWRLEGRA